MRELPAFGRGGWSEFVGGSRFGCGVGRRYGSEGGGIGEEGFALGAERVGGCCRGCGWDEGGSDGGCGGLVSAV